MADGYPEVVRIPGALLPNLPVPQSYDDWRGKDIPLVIDNGSTTLRFGFATSPQPITVTNVVSKFRERKQNKPLLLFGDAIDAESGARSQARTPWEGDVLLNFDALVSHLVHEIPHASFGPESNGKVTSDVGTIGECLGLCLHQLGDRHSVHRAPGYHDGTPMHTLAFEIP